MKRKNYQQVSNGYLNIYKNFMISSLKALDFFNEINSGKNCNTEGCKNKKRYHLNLRRIIRNYSSKI